VEEEIKNEDEPKNENMEEAGQSKFGQWIQDNMRVIISILVVVVIAGGIYSYSKRTEAPTVDEQIAQEEITTDEITVDEDMKATEGEKKEGNCYRKTTPEKVAPVASSQETEATFIETAGRGDSRTVLARRALANYLEKNQDSSLTPEHKIYIEDYLRKNVNHQGGVYVGTSIEFSKSMIQDAIAKSKTLTDAQLKNLHKYAVRVPSLT
jgi:hypothetical protein